MQTKLPIRLAGAALLAAACVQVAGATPPTIAAKQAQAARVLAEISTIDEQLNTVSEQFDGARVRLASLHGRLRSEAVALASAKVQYTRAERRAAKLLVYLYTSGRSSSLDVILGASSLSEVLKISDDENAISHQSALIAAQTDQARALLRARVQALERDQAAAQTTVAELAARRSQIEHGLAVRTRLLRSVQSQVLRLQAQERARQARLAAQARARLAAEAAARARAAAAAARAQARAQALAKAQAVARARAAVAARLAAQLAARKRANAAALRAATNEATTRTPTESQTTSATPTTTAAASPAETTPVTTPAPTTLASQTPVAAPTTSAATTTSPAQPAAATVSTPLATTTAPSSPSSTATSVTPAEPVLPNSQLPAGHPEAATIALQYIGVPYLWGGESPSGFDCSGLVAYVFAKLGVTLPHFAAAQWTYGAPVAVDQLQAGDLVFFDALNHVGIYIGDDEFIDAPHTGTFVRIDSLSDPWYASHYVGARRI